LIDSITTTTAPNGVSASSTLRRRFSDVRSVVHSIAIASNGTAAMAA